jgi:predicted DNA-binding transcriptional regulator AlpA
MALLNVKQLARELGVSVPTLYRISDLPRIRVGSRAVRFELGEVLSFLRNR